VAAVARLEESVLRQVAGQADEPVIAEVEPVEPSTNGKPK
jgi:hypothetical protein